MSKTGPKSPVMSLDLTRERRSGPEARSRGDARWLLAAAMATALVAASGAVRADVAVASYGVGNSRTASSASVCSAPIVESRIPASAFRQLLAPAERSYRGFFPYRLQSTEIPLRTSGQIDLFNKFIIGR